MARKRKQSRKARAASLRNLAKARGARRRAKRAHRKHAVRGHTRRLKGGRKVRVRAHRSYEEAAEAPRRKRGKRRSSKKRSAKRRTRRRRASEAYGRSKASYARAARKGWRNRKRSGGKKRGGGKKRKGAKRRSYKRRTPRYTPVKKYGEGSKAYYLPNVRERRRGRRKGRKHSHHRRMRAMENPLGMGEVIVGGITGLAGFAVAEVVDRLLATHALNGTIDANGSGLSDPGDANGHWNTTMILAPMSIARWGAGLGLGLVPIFGAVAFKGPKVRAALGFFGFGALVRTLGKGATDGIAYLTRKTTVGQRLFTLEDQAQMATLSSYDASPPGIAPGPTGLKGLPAGVGRCACPNCSTGIGACCQLGPATPTTSPTVPAGVPTTPPAGIAPSPPPPPPPPVMTTNPGQFTNNLPASPGNTVPGTGRVFPAGNGINSGMGSPLGVLGLGEVPKRNPYTWGSNED